MNPTLQILDAGDTFYRSLDECPLVVGSADDADVRLAAGGVAAHHARIERDADDRYRIVDLGSEPGTRVNGEDVAQWRLSIGDRIEVGDAVLVVGRRIARRATPEDVLSDAAPLARGAADARRASSRRRTTAERTVGPRIAIVCGLAIVVAVAIHFLASSADVLPASWGELIAMRRRGDATQGLELVDELRTSWAAGDEARGARLDAIERELTTIERELDAGRSRIRDEASRLSRAEQVRALQDQRRAGDDTLAGIVARRLSSELDELRLGIGRRFDGGAQRDPADQRAAGTTPADEVAPPTAATPLDDGDRFVRDQLAAVEALRSAGEYAQALETLRIALSSTAEDRGESLRETRIRLRAEVDREMRVVVERAHELVRGGDPAEVDRAIAMLREEGLRFPTEGEFGKIAAEQRALEDYRVELERRSRLAAGARVSATAAASLADLRDLLAEARRLERGGQFGAAASVIERAAQGVRSTDPLYAASLDGRSRDLWALAGLREFVHAEVAAGRDVVLDLSDLGTVRVELGADGDLLAGAARLPWSAVTASSIRVFLERAEPGPEALLGGAVLAYHTGGPSEAERLLVLAVKRDAALQPRVDGILARGRGETGGAGGYRLVDGSFVAVREFEVRKRSKELERIVARIAKLPPERRDAEIEAILAKGPLELDALIVALRAEASRCAGRIERDPFRRGWERVAARREELDDARAAARELIFDEERYFYPYRAPAVSAAREAEFWRVQAEVDDRVAAVRERWESDGAAKGVSARLSAELAVLDWSVELLADFAERMPDLEERVAWVRALPPRGEPLSIRTFSWDAREAEEHAYWKQIMAFNQRRDDQLTRLESVLTGISNDYRMMFGLRPLALNPKLLESARGHAAEMSKLGYFSHYSPTPGRNTPFERMRLADYSWGASENIANHPSAPSAHHGWTHSSGHHRNLLMPSHREFAVGNDGRYWVQNFGRGSEFENDEDWRRR